MMHIFFSFIFIFGLITTQGFAMPKLLNVQCIWNQAQHSAFTDLIEFKGKLFCAFRESDTHVASKNGTVRILSSEDGSHWQPVALLEKEGLDLRDPKFSIMPDGRLLLNMGGSTYHHEDFKGWKPQVSFSKDGVAWTPPQEIDLPNEWIWRVTWHQGVGYGISYRFSDLEDNDKPWIVTLFKTSDGLNYLPVQNLSVTSYPSEATVRFLPDGKMVALMRRYGNGWIGIANPPYKNWSWSEIDQRLGGPNFLILPNGEMWASSRYFKAEGNEMLTQTAVGPMTLNSYKPAIVLPSGGDTSYPGMVFRNGILYLSYYSSHEGKSCIYLAQIQIEK